VAKQKFGGSGRGLDALFSSTPEDVSVQQRQPSPARVDEKAVPLLPIDSIIPNPRQPRRAFREDDPKLLELCASIKEHGLLQPIVVTHLDKLEIAQSTDSWFGDDSSRNSVAFTAQEQAARYQIIAGERRWRASRLAGLKEVPAVIKDVTQQQMLELALIENIQRADLNPIEEALAYQALVEEFGLTHEKVAQRVGKERTTITNSLRLLQLVPKVREALINQLENFTEGHARALIGITREEDQVLAMEQVIALRLNVRQTEELADRLKAKENIEEAIRNVAPAPKRSPELENLESHFRNALMAKVDLKCNAKGKGTLVVHFSNQEELESLYNRLVDHQQ
jgi:ParB family transcriptional regulator, chromosome partitioning protein